MCFFTNQITIAYIFRPNLTTNSGKISEKLHFISAPPQILPTKFRHFCQLSGIKLVRTFYGPGFGVSLQITNKHQRWEHGLNFVPSPLIYQHRLTLINTIITTINKTYDNNMLIQRHRLLLYRDLGRYISKVHHYDYPINDHI